MVHPADSMLTLSTYDLVTPYTDESGLGSLMVYNYKTHALDRLDCATGRTLRSLPLKKEGPDGIPSEVVWMQCVSPNYILLFDGGELYAVDTLSHVQQAWYLPDVSRAFVGRNARTQIAEMRYDAAAQTVAYPVATKTGVEVVTYSLADEQVTSRTTLIEQLPEGNYGFFRYPNVSMTDSLILYNYPYEADFTILNLHTGAREEHHVPTSSQFPQWKSDDDAPEVDTWGPYEHTLYYNLKYLSEHNLYVQVVVGPTRSEGRQDLAAAAIDRPVYLRVFNPAFDAYTDLPLPDASYELSCGWFDRPQGMGFFVSPASDSASDEDTIALSFIDLSR